jgi:nucleotide-binding universal stress UspA family protein
MAWLPKNKVVTPVDFCDESFAALDTALELVTDATHLRIVHVLPKVEMVDVELLYGVVDHDARRRHIEQALSERLTDAKYQGAEKVVLFGDPGHEIADYSQREQADLIVLPSHGRTGISRMLIGSVAERVVRLAHCPVLVLRK